MDHVALLGPDLASIAREKAGIIKPGIPLVLGKLEAEASQVIEGIAIQKQAPITAYDRDYQVELEASCLSGQSFSYHSSKREKASYQVALLGHHQARNAALAISICDVLFEREGRELLSRELVDEALHQVVWPGRMEVVSQNPMILLDGAHNPHAVAPLIASLRELFPGQKKTILFTCIRTKALEEMLIQWQELENSRLILTTFEDPRAYSQEEIRAAAKNHQLEEVNWQEFLQNWQAEGDELLIVTGSLYFLSQIRPYLLKNRKIQLGDDMDTKKIEEAVKMIIEAVGEDENREGLQETPTRIAKMYQEIFAGLGQTAEEHLSKSFEIIDNNMVVEKDIFFHSMCEHHFLPFYGKVHIAYIPNGRVAGLSKLARTVEVYAKKPQIQERLTVEIADALMEYLGAQGALVWVEAEHMCMNMRGVRKPGTATVTTAARGLLATDKDLKNEAYKLMGH